MSKLNQPFFPFLLGIFPVISVYAHNQQHFLLEVLLAPILISLILVVVALGVCFLLLNDIRKAAFMAGACFTVLIVYAPLIEWLKDIRIETPFVVVGPAKVVAVLSLVALTALFIALRLSNSSLKNPTIVANVIVATMLILPAISIAQQELSSDDIRSAETGQRALAGFANAQSSRDELPDIYHFVLDGYGRWDTYNEHFGFDNGKFRQYLENREFVVSDSSRSNYTQTALTFASMFNGDYIQSLLTDIDRQGTRDSRAPLFGLIRQNAVFPTLANAGYRVQSFDSGYNGTDFSRTVFTTISSDQARPLGLGFLNEFESELLGLTPLPAAFEMISGQDRFSNFALRRARIEFAFDAVGQATAVDGESSSGAAPVYNLIHVLAPHGPHLYRADGTPLNPTEANATGDACQIIGEGGTTADVYIERHVGYVKYLNTRLSAAIDRILQTPDNNVVILLTSDHGPGATCERSKPLKPAYLRERTANLFAVYVPNAGKRAEFADLTPVNYYRALFNAYLGTDLPLLPNKVFFSPFETPFAFIDITEQTQVADEPAR